MSRILLMSISAPTRIICLENTLNGTIMPQSDIIEIAEFALKNGILMHLDGARLWHAAVETRTPIDELCAPFDSVSLCFSKGLGQYRHQYLRVGTDLLQVPPWGHVSSVQRHLYRKRAGSGRFSAEGCARLVFLLGRSLTHSPIISPSFLGSTL